MDLRGASAIVTGAGRGIGRSTALLLAREGVKVTLVARNRGELDTLVAEIKKTGGTAVAHAADVRDQDAPEAIVKAAVAAHGRVQILVNNAGVGLHKPLAETSDEDWDRILDTNVRAVFRLTRAALPHLTNGGGHIFMISSLAGANAIDGMSAYCASKAALDHMSRVLMLEVRQKGVKVTTICPGSVDTSFGALPRAGNTSWMLSADDVANAVLDLARTRDGAHLSRVEMRPAQPQKR